ncbi:MAG: tetratricopeptide repeat protein [Candidatus Polarisedimenticolia bacterium]
MRLFRPVVVCLSAFLLAAAPPSPEHEAALQSARAALAVQDFPAALAQLDRAIHLDPVSPAAFVLLGQASMRLERYADASEALARGAELAGGTSTHEGAVALNLLAYALARQDRNAEALDLLDRLAPLNARRPAAWLLRGNVQMALGRSEAARLDFLKVLQLLADTGPASGSPGPSDSLMAAAWQGLGITAYRLGDDAAALEALTKAPGELDARYHLALTLARRGNHAEALEAFQDVLAKEPTHRGALQGLARSAGALGRNDQRTAALSALESLYRRDEELRAARVQVSTLRTHSLARMEAGDSKGASADLEKAVQLAPDDLQLRLDLGRTLQMAGERGRSEQVLRAVIAQDPLNAEAHLHLGRLLLEEGDVAAAAIPLETACRVAPMKATCRASLGQAYLRAGRSDAGIEQLRLARSMAPTDPENAYNLGMGLAQIGALREATVELESAAALGLNDPRPHEALATLYARLGDTQRSRREQEILRRLISRPSTPA